MGNPPYNANQANENDNNKNRDYPRIDQLIKSSYIRLSTAQKTKVYDMYARFFRWASDRMADDGVLAFITNRSFIESRTFDGFRKAVAQEFNEIYVVDLGGDVRANPKLSGTKHNVFGRQTGVAISFFVKRHKQKGCKIFYARRPEFDTAEDKLAYLGNTRASAISFQRIEPDKNGNWVNLTENDWDTMIAVSDKKTKTAKSRGQEKAIFRLYSLGVVTSRDEWVYDIDPTKLESKVRAFIEIYESERKRWSGSNSPGTGSWVSRDIKWTSELEAHLRSGTKLSLNPQRIRPASYRPFHKINTYYDRAITHRLYQQDSIFPVEKRVENLLIVCTDPAAQKPWMASAVSDLPDLHYVGAAAGTHCLPRYRYTAAGERIDNITEWAH
nr:type ISP restriction/modification enzyme [Mesorhizobium sp.]